MDEFALRPEALKDRVWDVPAVRGYFRERPDVPKPAIHRNTKAFLAMSGSADLPESLLRNAGGQKPSFINAYR